MIDAAGHLGWLATALLFAALAAWAKLGRGRRLQTIARRAAQSTQEVENASRLLLITVVVSFAAAIVAFAGMLLA